MRPKSRIVYIEHKGDDGIVGQARIGRVTFSKSGQSIHYAGKTFETRKGQGFKSNYFDVETGEAYWISGCRKDGRDALYTTTAEIDEDVRAEYWTRIRGLPEKAQISRIKVKSKH
ncbi:1-deoxy-D-xylulose-5-phosphate synthase [Marinicella meishanensis]|uniref:1-deoxy-D-xylulose-5-phosphate synthase n=1 Tax=Marinicella meishanensis TaxID=2873263 RepID=UPI001CBFEAAD|nr:1-deoxy-D-xylulose-5-phosphate synthase [Marinicella sp. NBU2979]